MPANLKIVKNFSKEYKDYDGEFRQIHRITLKGVEYYYYTKKELSAFEYDVCEDLENHYLDIHNPLDNLTLNNRDNYITRLIEFYEDNEDEFQDHEITEDIIRQYIYEKLSEIQ
jgi:hypothetical protein